MQFRARGNRIQCYAAYYDTRSKRGRQRLVYNLSGLGRIEEKPTSADLTPADFGTSEQRASWTAEIAAFITKHNDDVERNRADVLPLMLQGAVDAIIADLTAEKSQLSGRSIAAIRSDALRLTAALGLSSPTHPDGANQKGTSKVPRSADILEKAQAFRTHGYTVDQIIEKLGEEGCPVTKAWVQKNTTKPKHYRVLIKEWIAQGLSFEEAAERMTAENERRGHKIIATASWIKMVSEGRDIHG